MITYELILELMNSGFQWNNRDNFESYSKELCPLQYYPTLSELIEACGEDLWILRKGIYKGENGWVVGKDRHEESNPHSWYVFAFGKNLDEAVAKFWLEINKK